MNPDRTHINHSQQEYVYMLWQNQNRLSTSSYLRRVVVG